MKKYWKARAASRLTRYSISQINICQGLFSLAVLFFDTQRTSFWVLGLLFPHHRAHLFPFLCTEYIHFYFLEQVLQRESSFWGRGKRLCMPYGHLEPAGCIVPAVRPALRSGSGRAGDGCRASVAVTGGSAPFALRPRLPWGAAFPRCFHRSFRCSTHPFHIFYLPFFCKDPVQRKGFYYGKSRPLVQTAVEKAAVVPVH